jgi:hypothetical protein
MGTYSSKNWISRTLVVVTSTSTERGIYGCLTGEKRWWEMSSRVCAGLGFALVRDVHV